MNKNIFTKKNWTWKKKLILLFVLSFILPFGFVNADHLGNSGRNNPIDPDSTPTPPTHFDSQTLPAQPGRTNRCRNITIANRAAANIPNGVPGRNDGEVPVYDNDASRNLVILVTALQEAYSYEALQDPDAQRTTEYLRLLCEKEYEEDHTLQHAWANLIGEFVQETQTFIYQGFNGNPAFITSQDAYSQLVDISTSRVFMQDIVDSAEMGNTAKRRIIESITLKLFENVYPSSRVLAEDSLPNDLSADFYGNGGFSELSRLFLDPNAGIEAQVQQALDALSRRIERQAGFEQEKLAWGRGFFSYEICDLNIYSDNVEDRRNCRIATPGSLIQDQTSFVFGSALRQMEINDEYEEWIAPNTLAVLSDILSYRGLNNIESRNANPVLNDPNPEIVSTAAASPSELGDLDIRSIVEGANGVAELNPNQDGPLPFEFSSIIDVELFNLQNGGAEAGILNEFFITVLDPVTFLEQINNGP